MCAARANDNNNTKDLEVKKPRADKRRRLEEGKGGKETSREILLKSVSNVPPSR